MVKKVGRIKAVWDHEGQFWLVRAIVGGEIRMDAAKRLADVRTVADGLWSEFVCTWTVIHTPRFRYMGDGLYRFMSEAEVIAHEAGKFVPVDEDTPPPVEVVKAGEPSGYALWTGDPDELGWGEY